MSVSVACYKFALNQGLYNALRMNQRLLNNAQETEDQHIAHTLCNILEQNLNVIQLLNNHNGNFYAKLAIMIIDGTIRLGADPIRISNEFKKRGIVLAIVAVETPVYETWDFYRELARNTDGEYMLLANASDILARVISSVLTGEDTLRQAFFHVNRENIPIVPNEADDNGEENPTIDDIEDLNFDHGLSH